MDEIMTIQQAKEQGCDSYVLQKAQDKGKYIVKITWDKQGGYPEHSWGYVQWTVRPFMQTQGCDGTIDMNVHCIGIKFCQFLGLDYFKLYDNAYSWRDGDNADWLREYDLDFTESQTIIPPMSAQSLKCLLYDLNDINHRSLVAVLHDEFTKLGYDVEEYWKVKTIKNIKNGQSPRS